MITRITLPSCILSDLVPGGQKKTFAKALNPKQLEGIDALDISNWKLIKLMKQRIEQKSESQSPQPKQTLLNIPTQNANNHSSLKPSEIEVIQSKQNILLEDMKKMVKIASSKRGRESIFKSVKTFRHFDDDGQRLSWLSNQNFKQTFQQKVINFSIQDEPKKFFHSFTNLESLNYETDQTKSKSHTKRLNDEGEEEKIHQHRQTITEYEQSFPVKKFKQTNKIKLYHKNNQHAKTGSNFLPHSRDIKTDSNFLFFRKDDKNDSNSLNKINHSQSVQPLAALQKKKKIISKSQLRAIQDRQLKVFFERQAQQQSSTDENNEDKRKLFEKLKISNVCFQSIMEKFPLNKQLKQLLMEESLQQKIQESKEFDRDKYTVADFNMKNSIREIKEIDLHKEYRRRCYFNYNHSNTMSDQVEEPVNVKSQSGDIVKLKVEKQVIKRFNANHESKQQIIQQSQWRSPKKSMLQVFQ